MSTLGGGASGGPPSGRALTRAEFLELVDAFALGHVDGVTRQQCEAFLARKDAGGPDDACRLAFQQATEAALALALTVAPVRLPERLWTGIEQGLLREPPRQIFPIRARPPRALPSFVWPSVAAGFAALSVGLGWQLLQLREEQLRASHRVSSLTSNLAETNIYLDGCRRGLHEQMMLVKQSHDLMSQIATPGMRLLSPQHVVKDAPAIVFMFNSADGTAFAMGGDNEAPAGKVYELWVLPKKGAPIPAGTFLKMTMMTAVELTHSLAVADIGALAISREPAPGGASPTEVVLVAKL